MPIAWLLMGDITGDFLGKPFSSFFELVGSDKWKALMGKASDPLSLKKIHVSKGKFGYPWEGTLAVG